MQGTQRTVQKPVSMTGIGLHSGTKVSLSIKPAGVNTGIQFYRTDTQPVERFNLSADLVKETTLCTCMINDNGARLSTVEHLMAAIAALQLDNLIIEVNSEEIPIADGSSAPFFYLLKNAGIEIQTASKRLIRITQELEVKRGDSWIKWKPFDGFAIDLQVDFDHPAIQDTDQTLRFEMGTHAFSTISRARTFGFIKDIEALQSQGLARGGSMDNAVVLDEHRILNADGLRYEDEFVRHKLLDAVGDLYMSGHQIIGEVQAYKSGHALNNLALRELLAHQECWEWFEASEGVNKFEDQKILAPNPTLLPIR